MRNKIWNKRDARFSRLVENNGVSVTDSA